MVKSPMKRESSRPELLTTGYDYLKREWDFSSTWVRTDFRFTSRDEAHDVIAPISGDAVLDNVIGSDEGVFLAECTGIWWRNT